MWSSKTILSNYLLFTICGYTPHILIIWELSSGVWFDMQENYSIVTYV
jgi:hypothetical protein